MRARAEGKGRSDRMTEALEDRLLETALAAAREAAEIHRREAGKVDDSAWREKEPSDFVTEVDLAAERVIADAIRRRFPDHAIVAEEGTQERRARAGRDVAAPSGAERAPIRWIVDPLDGTTNWLHGYPEYAVSIAALDGEGTVVGVVLNSATGETFHAVRGRGSHRDGERIATSVIADPRLGLIGTGFPFKRQALIPAYLHTLGEMLRRTSGVRRCGSAALDLCDLACGRLDGFWELWLMPWDVAAGALIVREAGGTFEPLEAAPAGAPESLWEELRESARAFERATAGGGDVPSEAGAYLGANGPLLPALKEILAAA